MSPELKSLVEKVRAADEAVSLFGFAFYDAWADARALAAIRCVAEATREATMVMEAAGNDDVVRQYEGSDWDDAKEMAEEMDAVEIYRAMHAASVLGEALRHE